YYLQGIFETKIHVIENSTIFNIRVYYDHILYKFFFNKSINNASISNFGGGFRCKSEYPWCIIAVKS
ncbi:Uncharacterized protein FWK35_00022645, partial [Aphis craccivora]